MSTRPLPSNNAWTADELIDLMPWPIDKEQAERAIENARTHKETEETAALMPMIAASLPVRVGLRVGGRSQWRACPRQARPCARRCDPVLEPIARRMAQA